MPALANPRHEAFARALHKLGVARKAYEVAGYDARKPITAAETSPLDRCASRLRKNVQVKQRLQELAAMAARRHDVTVDSLVEELDEAKDLAASLDNPAAMTQAIMGKARVTGHIIDRKEAGAPGDFASLQSADEVLELVRRELGAETAAALAGVLAKHERDQDVGGDTAAVEPTHDAGGSVN